MHDEFEQPVMVIADIHGSSTAMRQVQKRFSAERAQLLLIAGDLTPRYSETEAQLLNGMRSRIEAVYGNCDTSWDDQLLQFPLPEYRQLQLFGRTVFMTHGNRMNPDHLPQLPAGSIFISGHTHSYRIHTDEHSGIICLNPGSVSRPRGSDRRSTYALISEKKLVVCDLENGRKISSFEI